MIRRQTTKEILVESFKELAEQKPADKITVQSIVNNCDCSMATFYRHFHDKYDLIAWDHTVERKKMLDHSFTEGHNWRQMLLEGGRFYMARRDYLVNLLQNTSGHEHFIRYMIEINTQLLSEYLQEDAGKAPLSEDLLLLLKIYISGTVLMSCDWLLNDSSVPFEHMVDLFIEAIPEPLYPYLMREND